MIREAIILAGGQGTRLRAQVPHLPKPMAPVRGVPFLQCLLAYWGAQGIERFILAVGYEWKSIEAYFGPRFGGAKLVYSVEETPRGTGGALALAVKSLQAHDPFLVLNGDTFFEVDAGALHRFHAEKRSQLTLAVAKVLAESRYGAVSLSTGGRISRFASDCTQEVPTVSPRGVNGGVYLMDFRVTDLLAAYGARYSLERTFFPSALDRGLRAYGMVSGARFIDIGTPESYAKALRVFDLNEVEAWKRKKSWLPEAPVISAPSWSPS